jgi:hypothetical protein
MDPELQRQINIRSARGWRPNPGETIVGTVAHISKRESEYGDYPVVTLAADTDDPEAVNYVAVNAFHSILKHGLYDIKPQVGSRLAVTYHGTAPGKRIDPKTGKPVEYHSYTVIDPDAPALESNFSFDDEPVF